MPKFSDPLKVNTTKKVKKDKETEELVEKSMKHFEQNKRKK